MSFSTPVVFLIYNRPSMTETVFKAIKKIKPEKLLVVADGPSDKKPDDIKKCIKVRALIDRVDWKCKVYKNYSDSKLGCKKRISSGLNWAFEKVKEAIILEDDCLPHSSFFPFCQKMLEKYRDCSKVMMISGTNYLLKTLGIKESYYF